jgi:hypothetical protein
MKNKFETPICPNLLSLPRLIVAICLFAVLALSLVAECQAAERDTVVVSVTGNANLYHCTNATQSSVNSSNVFFPPNTDITLMVSTSGTAGTNGNTAQLGCNLSPDGVKTNFTTLLPVTVTVTTLGTSNIVASAVISRTNLIGMKCLRWDQTTTTQTNGFNVNWVRASWLSE